MSAAELLDEVKKLPDSERELFIDALLADEAGPQSKNGGRPIQWPDVEARAKLIVGDRIFDNPVLEERASRDF